MNKVLFLSILVLVLVHQNVEASSVRIGYTSSSADGLWIGETETDFVDANLGLSGKRTSRDLEFMSTITLSGKSSLFFGLTYREAMMQDIPFADVQANASRRGIAQYQFSYTREVLSFLSLGAGVTGAGDNKSGDTFIALSDGLTKYDFHASLSHRFGALKIAFTNRYTYRPGEINEDQLMSEFSAGYLFESVYALIKYANFNTFDGADIGTPQFMNGSSSTSPNLLGFSRVKEEFQAIAFSAAYIFDDNSVDFTFSKKLGGRNTDRSQSFGFGYSVYY